MDETFVSLYGLDCLTCFRGSKRSKDRQRYSPSLNPEVLYETWSWRYGRQLCSQKSPPAGTVDVNSPSETRGLVGHGYYFLKSRACGCEEPPCGGYSLKPPRSEFRFHGLLWGPSEAFDGKSLVRDSKTTKLAYQLHPDSMSGGPPITETPRQILRNGLRVTGA